MEEEKEADGVASLETDVSFRLFLSRQRMGPCTRIVEETDLSLA